jgi:hypothetical protein
LRSRSRWRIQVTSIQTPLETSTYNKENPYEIRKLSTLIGRLETKETAIGLSDDLSRSRNSPHLEPILWGSTLIG